MKIPRKSFLFLFSLLLVSPQLYAGEARSISAEWDKTVEAAKKEGALVAAIPASAELRKAITEVFPQTLSRHRARTHQCPRARPTPARSPPSSTPGCGTMIY